MKEIPTKKAPRTTRTGSLDTTKDITKTLSESKSVSLEQEAKDFKKRKSPPGRPNPMTSRIYLAGQAMNALLVRSQGSVRREDIKREAYEWADFMLSNE